MSNIQINGNMGDKEYLSDSLNMQKFIADNYNSFASECSNPNLKNECLNLLKEEHMIQTEIYDEMSKRGWYQVQQADQIQINQAVQKYMSGA